MKKSKDNYVDPTDPTWQLASVFSQLTDTADIFDFLQDLCTPAELRSMAERWRVAQMLNEEIPYRKIYEKTGVSTATVTRVARAFSEGKGYRLAIGSSGERESQ